MKKNENEIELSFEGTYHDLNKAHEEDNQDNGNREETLYPAAMRQFDNARIILAQVEAISSAQELEIFLSHLDTKSSGGGQISDGVATYDQYTSEVLLTWIEKKKELFFKPLDIQCQYFLGQLNQIDQFRIDEITQIVDSAKQALEYKKILARHLKQIEEVAQAKRTELQAKITQAYIDRINNILTPSTKLDVEKVVFEAEGDKKRNAITQVQLYEIKTAAAARISAWEADQR